MDTVTATQTGSVRNHDRLSSNCPSPPTAARAKNAPMAAFTHGLFFEACVAVSVAGVAAALVTDCFFAASFFLVAPFFAASFFEIALARSPTPTVVLLYTAL